MLSDAYGGEAMKISSVFGGINGSKKAAYQNHK
jgi:hypothetical protein